MRLTYAFMCGLFAMPLGFAAPVLKEKPKAPPIVGEWQRVGHLKAGESVFSPLEDHRQVFKADGQWEYSYKNGTSPKGMSYVIDLTPKFPAIDIRNNSTGDSGWRGIYKIEGDTLTLCLVTIKDERPQSFASNAENPTIIWVFKRIKPMD